MILYHKLNYKYEHQGPEYNPKKQTANAKHIMGIIKLIQYVSSASKFRHLWNKSTDIYNKVS